MQIGISLACFYPEHPEQTLAKLDSLNTKVTEFFVNTVSELQPAFLEQMASLAAERGIQIYSLHPFTSAIENYLFFSPYDRRMADAADFYERYFAAAEFLGARVVQMHGDKGGGKLDLDTYAFGIEEITKRAARHGIILAQENVFYNSVNCPEYVYKLRRKLGEGGIKFTFDIKQAHKGGQDPFAVCEAMGEDIVNFHVNDFDEDHICMLPGRGEMDYSRLFKLLSAQGYGGPALIEVYSNNFESDSDLVQSKKFLESVKY